MSRLFVLSQTGALSGALSHRHLACQAQDEDLLAHDSVGLERHSFGLQGEDARIAPIGRNIQVATPTFK